MALAFGPCGGLLLTIRALVVPVAEGVVLEILLVIDRRFNFRSDGQDIRLPDAYSGAHVRRIDNTMNNFTGFHFLP